MPMSTRQERRAQVTSKFLQARARWLYNISTNVPLFQAINALPIMLDPARLDEGGGIDQTLRKNKAKYHQSCRLMFNNSKLQRAPKRSSLANESTPEDSPSTRKIPRRSPIPSECFLCEKLGQSSELRHDMMQQLNDRVNECARTLSDGRLLAKLSGGDAIAQYDPACLVALYNRKRAYLKAISQEQSKVHTAKKCTHWPFLSW